MVSINIFVWLNKYSTESTRVFTWWELSQRPLRQQENRNTSSSPKALTPVKYYVLLFNRQKLCPENDYQYWNFNNKKGRNIISSKLPCRSSTYYQKSKLLFFSRKNSQNLITFHQATWEGAWEVSKLKQWGFYYFWWKALHTVLSFKCKWELDTNQIFFLF